MSTVAEEDGDRPASGLNCVGSALLTPQQQAKKSAYLPIGERQWIRKSFVKTVSIEVHGDRSEYEIRLQTTGRGPDWITIKVCTERAAQVYLRLLGIEWNKGDDAIDCVRV